jgi:hypothetical protein
MLLLFSGTEFSYKRMKTGKIRNACRRSVEKSWEKSTNNQINLIFCLDKRKFTTKPILKNN